MRTEWQNLTLPALAIAIVFAVFFCYLAYIAGQDANWDFYNYHYYNAYAFLNDRFWFDIQPAQRQTFFNPFLDIPFFWLTQKIGILGASLSYAAFQSLQAPALFMLCYVLIRGTGLHPGRSAWGALILTTIGLLAPLNFQQIGTTWGDSTTATLVLGGISVFFLNFSKALRPATSSGQILLLASAGALLGLAVGLKLTNGPYVVALMICIGFLPQSPKIRVQCLVVFCLASLLGFLLSYGYWGWFLYDQLQNPVFPQFNHIFQSDYIKSVPFTDERFKATRLSEIIFYPFYYNIFSGKISGQQFLDLRIPIAYLLIAGSTLLALVALLVRKRFSWRRPQASLLTFLVSAYVIWLLLFSLTRYALILEILAPLAVFCAVSVWGKFGWPARALVIIAILPIAIYSVLLPLKDQPAGPRVPWTDSTFDIKLPYTDLADAMVIVHGGEAMAFVIPSAPASARFVRVNSILYYVGFHSMEERYENALGRKIAQTIGDHEGLFYTLLSDQNHTDADIELAIFGLRRIEGTCRPITSKGGPPLTLCRAERDTAHP